MKELRSIQMELNALKNQYNAFGKYSYRLCEDILAAVKPLLCAHVFSSFFRWHRMDEAGHIYIGI